jgi:hypothetical protein
MCLYVYVYIYNLMLSVESVVCVLKKRKDGGWAAVAAGQCRKMKRGRRKKGRKDKKKG